MHIIGITGGIGAGKSEIIKYLQEHYNACVAKTDDIGHLGIKKDEDCYWRVIRLLGSAIIDEDGELNRTKIATIVHADKDKLTKLDAIIHPFVKRYIIAMIEEARAQGEKYFFIEAALLLEDNYDQICDETWYIYADCNVRCLRLAESRNYCEEKSRQIMVNQLSADEFKKRCDFMIDNSGDFANTAQQIDSRMRKYENV